MSKLFFHLCIILILFTSTVKCALPRECELPPDTGPCKAMFPSYYYNPSTKQCQSFVYGGCQGNDNRFETKEKCLANCGEEAAAADDI